MRDIINFDYLRETFDPEAYEPQLGKDAADYAAALKAAGSTPPTSLDIHVLRKNTDAFLEGKGLPYPAGLTEQSYEKTRIGGMPCYQLLHKNAEAVPTLVMYFAGGFCLSSMSVVQSFMANVAAHMPCNVILPDYPLSPEVKAPEVLTQVNTFLTALLKMPIGKNVVLMGWSSGGYLALTSALNLQNSAPELASHIKHIISIGGVFDLSLQVTLQGPYQKQQKMDTTSIGPEVIIQMMRWYLPEGAVGNEPEFCPVLRSADELKKLPPITMMAGDCEGTFGDAVFATYHLRKAGAPVQLMVLRGKVHNHPGLEVLSRDGVFVPELIAKILQKQSIIGFKDVVIY